MASPGNYSLLKGSSTKMESVKEQKAWSPWIQLTHPSEGKFQTKRTGKVPFLWLYMCAFMLVFTTFPDCPVKSSHFLHHRAQSYPLWPVQGQDLYAAGWHVLVLVGKASPQLVQALFTVHLQHSQTCTGSSEGRKYLQVLFPSTLIRDFEFVLLIGCTVIKTPDTPPMAGICPRSIMRLIALGISDDPYTGTSLGR